MLNVRQKHLVKRLIANKLRKRSSKKIGILSDTHKKTAYAIKAIDMLIQNGAEFLIHAGDIVQEDILEYLNQTGKRYIAVYGNNDPHLAHVHNKYHLVQEPYYFKLANTSFKLMHLPYYMTNDAEVVIFGHTHTFEVEYKGETLYINPGEICARKRPRSECVLLEVTPQQFKVEYFTRKVDKEHFELKKEFTFQRE